MRLPVASRSIARWTMSSARRIAARPRRVGMEVAMRLMVDLHQRYRRVRGATESPGRSAPQMATAWMDRMERMERMDRRAWLDGRGHAAGCAQQTCPPVRVRLDVLGGPPFAFL